MTRVLSILMILFSFGLKAQNPLRVEIDLQELANRLAPLNTEEINYEEILENLYTLYQNPLDINKSDRNDLSALFFLSERQINELLMHKERFGKFLSLYELQSLPSFTIDEIRDLLPFVTINEEFGSFKPKSLIKRATEHYLVLRADQTIERSRGFSENHYAGSPQRLYFRYRLSKSKDFSIGFLSEKDPGETRFFDYTAFHLQIQNKGPIKNLVVGDYLMQFGQGLIFSGGYVAGKGGEPVYTTRRSNLGIRPYSSLIENGSFRGVATTYQLKNMEWTAMASIKKRDGNILNDSEDDEAYFSSLLSSGLHRTPGEIAQYNAILEQNYGGNLLYKLNHLQLGFSFLNTQFNKSYQKRGLLYNQFDFSGTNNIVLGPNISISWNNFNFFGEAAQSSSGGYGLLFGWVGSLGKQVEWALNIRNYQPDFHTFYGNAFSENSRTINEKGVYNGLKYIVKKGLEIVAYYDRFSFPWLKYRVDAPSIGEEYLLRVNYKPSKKFNSSIAFRSESKERNPSSASNTIREPIDTDRQTMAITSEYLPSLYLKLQSRVQYNNFRMRESSNSSGWAFIQDVEGRLAKIQLKGRIAYFRTDTYDSRIYAYENDVLYSVSFPAYFGTGFRYYLLTKVPISKNLDAWLRVAQTQVSDSKNIGSGYDVLPGSKKTDIKVQLKLSL